MITKATIALISGFFSTQIPFNCIAGKIGGVKIWRKIYSMKSAGSKIGAILVFCYQRQLSRVAVATRDNCN